MKTKLALTGILLFLMVSFQLQAQTKEFVISKPTFEKKMEGLDLKIWIVDQNERDHAARDTSSRGMAMSRNQVATNMPRMEELTGGTHQIILQARESEKGKEIEDAPKIIIVSPSKGAEAVELKAIRKNYGGILTLNEKGEYEFTVTVNVNGAPEVIPFKYIIE